MLKIVGAGLDILAVALVPRILRQPPVFGHLAAGVVLGPHDLTVVSGSEHPGAHLARISELSFVLAAVGAHSRLITIFGYQLTLSVIAATLILSPAGIALAGRSPNRLGQPIRTEPLATA